MNIQNAENFIYKHKLPVCAVLLVTIVCCLCITTAEDFAEKSAAVSHGVSYTIRNEYGQCVNIGPDEREEVMEFGRICLNNVCTAANESTFNISGNDSGVYTVYEDRGSTGFYDYYNLYPHAVISSSGKIDIHIHRRF